MQVRQLANKLNNVSILLVEDEPDLRLLLNVVFSSSGAHVTATESVDDALKALGEHVPDVLISDIGMPGRDGYDLIREVKGQHQRLEIHNITTIAMSAYSEPQYKKRAIDEGFEIFLEKPVDSFAFVDIIAGLIRNRSPGAFHLQAGIRSKTPVFRRTMQV